MTELLLSVCGGGLFVLALVMICVSVPLICWFVDRREHRKPPKQYYVRDTSGKLAYWTPSRASLLCVTGEDWKVPHFNAREETYDMDPAWRRERLYLTRNGHYVLSIETKEKHGFWTYGQPAEQSEISETRAMNMLGKNDVLKRTELGESLLKEKTGRDLEAERTDRARREEQRRASEKRRKERERKAAAERERDKAEKVAEAKAEAVEI